MAMLPDPQGTLMLVEHFGYIEFVNPMDSCIMDGGVQLPTNTIFQIESTAQPVRKGRKQTTAQEFAIATYTGLYFIHVTRNKQFKRSALEGAGIAPPPYDVNLLKEVYFKDKNVSCFLEYSPGLFCVCLYKDDCVHLLNRHD